MPRLPNVLVYDLLELADGLARQTGRANLRKAAMRRAISNAYYAVFHSLCFVCASVIVGWGRTEDIEPVYRLLDHAHARRRLASGDAAHVAPVFASIGAAFAVLQEQRHLADYCPPNLAVNRDKTLALLARARETVEIIESLTDNERRKLAVLLITKARLA